MVQWLKNHLSMQWTQVQSPVWEDSTCLEAAKPAAKPQHHDPSAQALEARSHNPRKPAHPRACALGGAPLASTRGSPCIAMKNQHSQKENKQK